METTASLNVDHISVWFVFIRKSLHLAERIAPTRLTTAPITHAFIPYLLLISLGVWDRGLMTIPVSDRPLSYNFGLGHAALVLVLYFWSFFPTLLWTTRRCVTW